MQKEMISVLQEKTMSILIFRDHKKQISFVPNIQIQKYLSWH